ncbi:unnamed protein product [Angiostrongylus costaricensis]|uniref:Glycosyltransferase family 92 protein n=1 Tax=Angiostrongylus costaricensis TaxID=334426 RepID=A0A0R3PY29_ANGCS|nr:unnamed protein product [Angiostrongylus costaricensis]
MHIQVLFPVTRHRHLRFIVCLLIVLSLTIVEEVNVGTAFIALMNYYGHEVSIPIQIRRGANTAISIVVVVQYASNKEQYREAQDTVQCYALHHRYPLHVIVVEENTTLSRTCPQNDFMFQRHCVVAHLIFAWPEEWFLFLDADMAIINPNHLIEEYIPSDPTVHVVFYNRIFNHEVMAGSYLIRKSNYSRNFLIHWSDYEYKLPSSFHGSDNGALHSAIVSYEQPLQENSRKRCESFWATSKDYDSLSIYEVCMQLILASNSLQHILILQKGTAWARDGWLTNSVWCDKDFILHGWQKRRKDKMSFARWHSPVVDGYWDKALCGTPHAHLNWRYKDSFIASAEAIQMRLDKAIRNVRGNFEGIQVVLERANGAES